MKTLTAFILSIASLTSFAGPAEIVSNTAPTPAPTSLFSPTEFNISAFTIGDWTVSRYKQDQYIGADHAFGGAIAAKYYAFSFSGVQLGAGIDQTLLDSRYKPNPTGRRLIGTTLGQIVARYPIGNFAPYVSIGGGTIYGGGYANQIHVTTPVKKALLLNDSKFAWSPAAGVEYRLSKNIGILAEADWLDVGPKKNSYAFRTGLNFAF